MKKLLLLNLMLLLLSWSINAQTATPPAVGDGSVDHPYEIATLENLYWIGASDVEVAVPTLTFRLASHYIQTANIDASETADWGSGGWLPIGNYNYFGEFDNPFKGNYNGKGHTISGLTITGSTATDNGLFGYADGAVFQNLGVTDVYINVEGDTKASAALLGLASSVQINNCYSTGVVNNCYSTGVVKENDYTGGLVGSTYNSTINNSYSTCEVSGNNHVGGFIGYCNSGNSIINCSHTTGTVKGNVLTGGLTGFITYGQISLCYSTGAVFGGDCTGGLVGGSWTSTISDCYSRCIVSTSSTGGGLVGENYYSAIIDNCYSTGFVTVTMGGLVGDQDDGSITSNSFWDIETSGTTKSAAGEGKNTTDMKTQSTFTDAGWDFSTIWGINADCNEGYPCLRQGFPPLVNITCDVSGEICSNTEPTFTATPFGADGGNVSYSWKVNGESFGEDKNQYTLGDLKPGYVFVVSCEITVTNTTNCESASATSEEITISVSPLPDAGEITGNNVILVGETTSLSSNEPGGFWLSDEDDLDVATVDAATGIVTGISVGTATIYYYKEGIVSECYNFGRSEFQVTVVASSGTNTSPEISEITPSTTDPIAINESFSITVSYSDVDDNVETAEIDWGGGLTTNILSQAADQIYPHTYDDAGVYTITVSVDDGYGAVTTTYQYVVVYDPSAGFVTGGGWIESPTCVNVDPAYGYMDVSGKASFGFVAKYQKGKVAPDGSTEFQFSAGGLNFKSTDYEWLIIADSKAMYKGSGTINGSGYFGFMLSAIDADLAENTETDLFRIKIWDKNNADAIVYDNQCGADDYADLDQTTAIAGGSIVIHSADKKTKSAEIADAISPAVEQPELNVYPNPFSEQLTFEFVSPMDAAVRIDMYDMTGRLVKTVFSGTAEQGVSYNAQFLPDEIISGMYFYRMIMGNQVFTGKVTYSESR